MASGWRSSFRWPWPRSGPRAGASGSRCPRPGAAFPPGDSGSPLERADLGGGELAPRARLELAEPDRSETNPDQLVDRQAEDGAQASHHVLATLTQPDLEPGLVRQRLQPSHARRDHAALVEAHAATQPSQLATAGRAVHLHVIDALDLPGGMHETLRQRP